MLKILYINTSDKMGGAAIACDRLRVAIRQLGGSEDMSIVHQRAGNDKRTITVASTMPKRYRKVEGWIKRGMMGTGYQYRYMPFTYRAILAKAKKFKPNVINLHNLHAGMEGYVPLGLIKALSKIAPLVWTFHDMWPLTGHCAYAMDCERWQTGCGHCPDLKAYPAILLDKSAQNWKHKKSVFQASDITVVTPSRWLENESRKSPLFAGKRIETINNGLNLGLYTPGSKAAARAALGLPDDRPVLMFVAQTASDNVRKGTKDLFDIVDKLSTQMNRPLTLLTLGHGKVKPSANPNVQIVSLGYVSDEKKIVETYQAADMFLFPTRADNLPNSLVEAMCCGTPCATFDIGGCGEIVQDDVNGILVPPFEVDQMVQRLMRFFNSDEERQRLSETAYRLGHERYDWSQMARSYWQLMRELVIGRRERGH